MRRRRVLGVLAEVTNNYGDTLTCHPAKKSSYPLERSCLEDALVPPFMRQVTTPCQCSSCSSLGHTGCGHANTASSVSAIKS